MRPHTRQGGIALPIMLIMLTVMLVSSIYLLKSSTSTTLTTSNLAYDASLSKATDLGIHTAFAYLRSMPSASVLENSQPANGYVATLSPNWTASTPAFWQGSVTLAPDPSGNRVEYVIHRLCDFAGAFNAPGNRCLLTSARPNSKSGVPYGRSGRSDSPNYLDQPQLHYVVTARIVGARGGNVVTQAVVMKGP